MDELTPRPVPREAIESLRETGRQLDEQHAREGLPAATLRAAEIQELTERADRLTETHRARALLEISSELPETVDRAMVSTHAALLRWRGLALEAREAATAFYREDVQGSSIRIRCTELLQQDEYAPAEPSDGFTEGAQVLVRKAMSYSAADKAASDHPLYQQHKHRRLELGSRKAETERKATEALETLRCQQLYLTALTTLTAHESGPGYVARTLFDRDM